MAQNKYKRTTGDPQNPNILLKGTTQWPEYFILSHIAEVSITSHHYQMEEQAFNTLITGSPLSFKM